MQTIYATFNKSITPLNELKISVLDRAYFFGDAVYEVLRVYNGQPALLAMHLERLTASLTHLGIKCLSGIEEDLLQNIAKNKVDEGMVYVQASRGGSHRMHSFFKQELEPNVLIYTQPFLEHPSEAEARQGIRAITHDDLRWGCCHIKSVNLLPNCLAQSSAHQVGAQEAILIKDDYVTEGSTSNVFIVKDQITMTPPLSMNILPGTRRKYLIQALAAHGHHVIERPIKKPELFAADEVFITSTIKEALPVTHIDQQAINGGRMGPMAKRARDLIVAHVSPAKAGVQRRS